MCFQYSLGVFSDPYEIHGFQVRLLYLYPFNFHIRISNCFWMFFSYIFFSHALFLFFSCLAVSLTATSTRYASTVPLLYFYVCLFICRCQMVLQPPSFQIIWRVVVIRPEFVVHFVHWLHVYQCSLPIL